MVKEKRNEGGKYKKKLVNMEGKKNIEVGKREQ